MKNPLKDALPLIFYSAFFFAASIFLSGCVPTPSDNTNVPPKITDLHFFFLPEQPGTRYLWHYTRLAPQKDSAYFLEYIGQENMKTSEGFMPVSLLEFSDTLRKDSLISEAYISDSLIVMYFGKSSDSLTPREIMLRDTLEVGAGWNAADNFRTSDGAHVSIRALVEDYYPETNSAGKSYQDVFLVSYTVTVKGTEIPLESQYQNGVHLSRYYARGIGDILERCSDSKDSLLWTNELMETRIR
ncbi:MAG: hypothetical protein ACHQM6_06015 [Candidatus Kapaibacterium sp.]